MDRFDASGALRALRLHGLPTKGSPSELGEIMAVPRSSGDIHDTKCGEAHGAHGSDGSQCGGSAVKSETCRRARMAARQESAVLLRRALCPDLCVAESRRMVSPLWAYSPRPVAFACDSAPGARGKSLRLATNDFLDELPGYARRLARRRSNCLYRLLCRSVACESRQCNSERRAPCARDRAGGCALRWITSGVRCRTCGTASQARARTSVSRPWSPSLTPLTVERIMSLACWKNATQESHHQESPRSGEEE